MKRCSEASVLLKRATQAQLTATAYARTLAVHTKAADDSGLLRQVANTQGTCWLLRYRLNGSYFGSPYSCPASTAASTCNTPR